MSEDGTMARMDDLVAFAQRHGLKIGTIRDLIAYRARKDHLVEQTAEARFGAAGAAAWTAQTFLNKATGDEQIALVKGGRSREPTLGADARLDLFADVFGEEGASAAACSKAR